jgi:thiamine biosynthesis lipoprotein
MGTMMSAAAWGPDSAALDRVLDAVRDTTAALDSLLSTFRDDSEISRVNRGRGTREGERVSMHFAAVLGEALAVARASGGAFDPTKRDWRGVAFDSARGAVRLRPGVTLDFGGIAKGYALDRAAALLGGVADSALLDLGGQFLWIGGPTHRTVGIADPRSSLTALAAVELQAGSVSTSSQAEQPDHIVDARGGRPRPAGDAERSRSVTVLAARGIAADAWSTALFVLGCDSALALAPRLAAWRISVVCADAGAVRWTPDLDGRVFLPTGEASPHPPRPTRPGPAAPPARGP